MDNVLQQALLKTNVYILAGPSGCGKTFLANKFTDKFTIVDYDKTSLEEILNVPDDVPTLIVTPIRASYIAKSIRSKGIRVCMLYLREDEATIEASILARGGKMTDGIRSRIKRYEGIKDKAFNFYGNRLEMEEYLNNISFS